MKKIPERMAVFFLVLGLLPPLAHAGHPNVATGSFPFSQELTVGGIVTDVNGVPIPGVHVQVQAGGQGTVTAEDGRFTLAAGPNDSLIFSALGFITQTVAVGQRQEIAIRLKEAVTELDEAVVNAGYYTVSEKVRTGTIARVKASEIEKQPISNPLAALQGRVAGVEIEQTSGLAGANFNIRIRGRNSIRPGAGEPLYIIDGVPFSSSTLGEQQASITLPGTGVSPLNNINPTDIESIAILKDADATAIYGSRGANGVVLITTKRGKPGATRVEFNIMSGLGTVVNKMDLLDTEDYLVMRREAYANDGINPLPVYAYDVNGTWDQSRETDWQKTLFGKTAYLNNIQGSISGGNRQMRFLVSGNYHRQSNVFPGSHRNEKASVLTNLNHRSENDRLSVQFSASYTSNRNDLPPGNDLVSAALNLSPNAPPVYNAEGDLNWENSTWTNPLAALERTYRSDASTLISNALLEYRILEDLKLSASLGYTENHLRELSTVPSTIYDPAFGAGPQFSNAVHNSGKRTSWILEPQVHFGKNLGATRIEALAGLTIQEQNSDRISFLAFGFTNNNLITNLTAASDLFPLAEQNTQYRYQAAFGRVNLNHRGKYILNLTGRRDGSSRFGPNRRYATFWATGGAWLFSKENLFVRHLPFISFGKLRGSYGTSGNDQIGDYQYLDTYSFWSAPYQNIFGLYPTRLYNPDFSWEENKKLEGSLELGFFEDRIFLNATYYRNRSTNQLVGIPLPGTTGFPSLNANLNATVENRGWELELNTVNVRSPKFEWTTSINLTIPRNELVAFPDLEGSTYANQLVIGEPLNIVKLYQWNGVNPDTGLHEFEDFNGDGTLSFADDRQVVRDLNPRYFGGMSNRFLWGKFGLDVLFQYTKQLGLNYWSSNGVIVGGVANQPEEALGRWQEPGDLADIQGYSSGEVQEPLQAFRNYGESDAAISDASYLRLRTLSISYQLTGKEQNGFDCELYLRGQNLWTWSTYLGLDPENRNPQTIPPLRFLSLGTRLTF